MQFWKSTEVGFSTYMTCKATMLGVVIREADGEEKTKTGSQAKEEEPVVQEGTEEGRNGRRKFGRRREVFKIM